MFPNIFFFLQNLHFECWTFCWAWLEVVIGIGNFASHRSHTNLWKKWYWLSAVVIRTPNIPIFMFFYTSTSPHVQTGKKVGWPSSYTHEHQSFDHIKGGMVLAWYMYMCIPMHAFCSHTNINLTPLKHFFFMNTNYSLWPCV